MIPETIDPLQLIADLNAAGWRDYKIEMCAGLAQGEIHKLRKLKIKNPRYPTMAKLYNFHEAQFATVPHGTEKQQNEVIDSIAEQGA